MSDECIVYIDALRALGDYIALQIPELDGHICTGVAPPSEIEELPNLSINPGRWETHEEQELQHATLPGNVVVYEVGEHVAPCLMSVVASTPGERMQIEQKLISLFKRQKHPLSGLRMTDVIVLAVSDCPQMSIWFCSYDLDSTEWVDTLALDRRYEARIMVTATVPALVIDTPVYDIKKLVLGVAQLPGPSQPTPPVDLVIIDVDGIPQPLT